MPTVAQLFNTFVNVNPATGEQLGEHACASVSEVQTAVATARRNQPAWAALGVRERVSVLRRFAALLLENKLKVAGIVTAEAGKPLAEALLSEVMVVLDAARFVSANATRVLRPEEVPHGNPALALKRGRLLWEPYGVIGIISPWNYPFSVPATEVLAALAVGNAVVLKPSELTPDSALILRELLHRAGVPLGAFGVVLGAGETGAALVNAGVDKIIFTGSVATGRRVGMAAAEKLIPATLELGGKDAMLVLDDASVDIASSAAVWGAMMNAGQTCISVERCLVDRKIYKDFVEACRMKIEQLKVGSGAHPETDMGPMISQRQLEIVERQVEDARARGAQVLAGGKRLPELGANFYGPTLIVDVPADAPLMCEETFGPVLPVTPFDGDEDGIRRANASEFGLAASVWTRNRRRGERVARRIEAGTVMVNDLLTGFAISEAPHGGIKLSGVGRTHGMLGLRDLVRPRYLDEDKTGWMKKLWWYGYGPKVTRQLAAFNDLVFARSLVKKLAGAFGSAGMLFRRRR